MSYVPDAECSWCTTFSRMGSLRVLFVSSLVALSLAACDDSLPIVDDIKEDASLPDAGRDAEDSGTTAD